MPAPVIEVPWEPAQLAVYTVLKAEFDQAPVIPVYDDVPQDAEPPYIEIGQHRFRRSGSKTESGWEGTIDVVVWSKYRGLKEASEIAGRGATALSADGAISGVDVGDWELCFLDVPEANTRMVKVGKGLEVQGIVQVRLDATRTP